MKIMESKQKLKLEEQLDAWNDLKYRLLNEGVDYALEHYSDWKEIKDEEFHKLRDTFLETLHKINELIERKIEKLEDVIYE
jgi:hypothetical protein